MKTKFNKIASSGFAKAMCVVALCLTQVVWAQQKGTFTDDRDGKVYKTVKIGDQVWMAENLNYEAEGSKCYGEDGSVYKSIYQAEGIGQVCTNPIKLSKNDIQNNCKKYGSLYNWETAMKSCPMGWHLPTNAEWDYLYNYVDSNYKADYSSRFFRSLTAGKYLKAKNGWNSYKSKSSNKSGNGTDKYGFAALPGGGGNYTEGECRDSNGQIIFGDAFHDVGNNGYWWSATKGVVAGSYYRWRMSLSDDADCWNGWGLMSVRCLQNISLEDLEERDGVYYRKGTNVPYSGEVMEDYMDSTVIGNMKNGKRHGEWKYPSSNETLVKKYEDGKLLEMGNYIYDKKHGEWKYFDSNEGLRQIENYINGVKHGEWKEFNFDGKLLRVKTYKDDKEHGEWKEFYANGNLYQIDNYIYGVKHGEVKSFYDNGNLKATLTYKEGKLHGDFKIFDVNGNLQSTLNYKDDNPYSGEMKYFHANGNLQMVTKYNDGKQTETKIYDVYGNLQEINYKDGKPIEMKFFDKNGNLIGTKSL